MFNIMSNFGPTNDFADVGNTVIGDTSGGEDGTYEPASEADVSLDVTYGEDGAEFTGSGTIFGTGIFFLRR